MGRIIQATEGELFYAPFGETLVKGVEENGKWNIYLQASNEGIDQDDEVVLCKALKDAADYYMTHGVISYDHKHKILHDPGFIIGEPTDVAFTDKNETLVKGFLYKENKIAQNLWDNIQSGAKRLGASVGGGILKKAKDVSDKIKGLVSKVIWDEVAVTHKPVNDGTLGLVSIIPFAEFAKALMAGSGVNAAHFTGGRALTGESLMGATSNILHGTMGYETARLLADEIIINIRNRSIKSHADLTDFIKSKGYSQEVAARLIKYIAEKMPNVIGRFKKEE